MGSCVLLSLAFAQARPATSEPEPPAQDAASGCRAAGTGAAPGDTRGPGRFVDRAEEKSFYAASGGQLWYYFNLYKWAPEGVDRADLWIQEEVVEQFEDLRRWPDGTPVVAPPKKTTLEYWEVGATGRTKTIDNHKDFWLLSENWCAGAIRVTTTLRLGRVRVRGADGEWARPRTHYVLDRRNYGPEPRVGAQAKFEALATEPTTVWEYRIPWSACPNRFVRSNWESLRVPEIRLVRVEPAPAASKPTPAPVVTEDR